MIERQRLNGRSAIVAYLTDKFEPADKGTAELIKVVFEDDNSTMWLSPPKK